MRLFALICFAVAIFYGYTAIETMHSGVATPMRGGEAVHRRDDPNSNYTKYLAARWVAAVGFIALGAVMNYTAGRFEKLERESGREKPLP